jgi:hypothetical protein
MMRPLMAVLAAWAAMILMAVLTKPLGRWEDE